MRRRTAGFTSLSFSWQALVERGRGTVITLQKASFEEAVATPMEALHSACQERGRDPAGHCSAWKERCVFMRRGGCWGWLAFQQELCPPRISPPPPPHTLSKFRIDLEMSRTSADSKVQAQRSGCNISRGSPLTHNCSKNAGNVLRVSFAILINHVGFS